MDHRRCHQKTSEARGSLHVYTLFKSHTVAQRLEALGLKDSLADIAQHNPQLLSLTLVDAQNAVIELLDGKSKKERHSILYHPLSGLCAKEVKGEGLAMECWDASKWNYKGDGSPIRLKGTHFRLKAIGEELPVAPTTDCKETSWKLALIPNSSYQVKIKMGMNCAWNGILMCLKKFSPRSALLLRMVMLMPSSSKIPRTNGSNSFRLMHN
ncbi:hypothetical protein ACH5RR_041656 [Cinchona calisaya]|uniref:Uncharacterized protein n=1 Tax=Cinchona calisaya TaxID=153742 RepID=A0ABD2XXH7_9GENT